MKATIICGTADQKGATMAMCLAAKKALESKGYEAVLIRPSEMDLAHCRDCAGCKDGRCVIEDDMVQVFEAFSESDLFVFATPIHFSGPSSLTKTVMDRFQPYWYDRKKRHPSACVAMMCGGNKEPNFEYTERIIKAFCLMIGMEFKGSLKIADTDSRIVGVEESVERFLDQSI